MSTTRVGGMHPGEVTWLDDHVVIVWCDGHTRPDLVYEAACYEGADLDDVTAVESGPDRWCVGPSECLTTACPSCGEPVES